MNIINRQLVFVIILVLGVTSIFYSWSLLPCLGDCLQGKIEQSHLSGDVLSNNQWTEEDNTIGSCENCDTCADYYHSSANSIPAIAFNLPPTKISLITLNNNIPLLGHLPDPYRSPPA